MITEEGKQIIFVTVHYSCGHSFEVVRPPDTLDPLNCFCATCHPEPDAFLDGSCRMCLTKTERVQ